MKSVFTVKHPSKGDLDITLTGDIIMVGKLPSSCLRIEDENVSRIHAVIEVTSPEEVYIVDLGSMAGTLVNGKKVNKARIRKGDTLTFGSVSVEVKELVPT
jgi:pSer/pThr/pTyr-binding forkhead associated (FHA) protein